MGDSPSSFLPSLESFAKGTVATAAGLGTVGVGLLFFGQNYLIYPSAFPPGSRVEVPAPTDFGLPYTDLELLTLDNVKLRCYLLTQRRDLQHMPGVGDVSSEAHELASDDDFAASRPTILMFHGNGGNVGHRIPLAKVFCVKMRCNVLMVSYRGYGRSEGSPSEKGIRMDAQAALDYVLGHEVLSRTTVVLYGQSIGGAVSIDLASRNQLAIRALILENTFLSLPRLVPSAFPILGPFAFLCHQKWDSAAKVPGLPQEMPVLMLSGARDEVVPPEHMRLLWELVEARVPGGRRPGGTGRGLQDESAGVDEVVGGERGYSRFVEFERGTHNDTCVQPGYWTSVAEFIASLGEERREVW